MLIRPATAPSFAKTRIPNTIANHINDHTKPPSRDGPRARIASGRETMTSFVSLYPCHQLQRGHQHNHLSVSRSKEYAAQYSHGPRRVPAPVVFSSSVVYTYSGLRVGFRGLRAHQFCASGQDQGWQHGPWLHAYHWQSPLLRRAGGWACFQMTLHFGWQAEYAVPNAIRAWKRSGRCRASSLLMGSLL